MRTMLLLALIVPFFALAHQTTDVCEDILAGSAESVYRQFFSNWEQNYQDGLGVRGFMGNAIPNSPVATEIAMEHGLIWWGMKFNIVPDIQAAIAHRAKARAFHEAKGTVFTDQIVAGIYLIGDEAALNITFDESGPGSFLKPVPADKVKALIANGGYEIDEFGEATFVSSEQLARRVSLDGMQYANVKDMPQAAGLNSISQGGWVTFKKHGIHDYSKWKNATSAKRLRALAKKLHERGWEIRFNHDYEAAMNMLSKQKRSYRDGDERKAHKENANRYSNKDAFNTMLSRLKAGKGYSVEIYNEAGELVGGEVGHRFGNHLYGDSVFYDERFNADEHGFDGVEIAKIAGLALMDVMFAGGMPYTDPGMITAYTHSMGAELVPFPEFRRLIKSGPTEPIALPAIWSPQEAGYIQNTFLKLSKRKGDAIGGRKFLSRLPLENEESLAAAAAVGMERTNMRVMLVPTLEDAKEHAKNLQAHQMPVYMIGSFTSSVTDSKSAQVAFQKAFEQVTNAVWFKNPKYIDQVQNIDLKKLREMVAPDFEREPVAMFSDTWPEFSLSVWAFAR